MKTLTLEKLKELHACQSGIAWFLEQETNDLEVICNRLLGDTEYVDEDGHTCLDYLNWLLPRLMDKEQCIKLAIYAAELALPIFEKEYPEDDRPRKAIQAARAYLAEPSKGNRKAAEATGWAANATNASEGAYWAARAAAGAAAGAAACAAGANVAWYAASAAAAEAAYWSAADARAAKNEVLIKCSKYGMELLGLEVKENA